MLSSLAPIIAAAVVALAPPPDDHVVGLVGDWTCTTGRGAVTALHYERDRDTVILKTHVVPAQGDAYDLRELYRWDGAALRWIVDSAGGTSAHMQGSGPAWTETVWLVQGTMRALPALPEESLRYTRTDAGFTREFVENPGAADEKVLSSSVCAKR